MRPSLQRIMVEGVAAWTDTALRERGILVAFSERGGGRSAEPFDSLNLAYHVGDDPGAVAENRRLLLEALGIGTTSSRLATAEQVHGAEVYVLDGPLDAMPIPGVDALVTAQKDLPLMLLYADCVPVVIVTTGDSPGVAVAHAGWRGAAESVHMKAAESLMERTSSTPEDLIVYIGPYIGGCHYEVGEEVLAHFPEAATLAGVRGHVDLGSVVVGDLEGIGVPHDRVCHLAVCTAEDTRRFFSFRAEGTTGRHSALVAILGEAT